MATTSINETLIQKKMYKRKKSRCYSFGFIVGDY